MEDRYHRRCRRRRNTGAHGLIEINGSSLRFPRHAWIVECPTVELARDLYEVVIDVLATCADGSVTADAYMGPLSVSARVEGSWIWLKISVLRYRTSVTGILLDRAPVAVTDRDSVGREDVLIFDRVPRRFVRNVVNSLGC